MSTLNGCPETAPEDVERFDEFTGPHPHAPILCPCPSCSRRFGAFQDVKFKPLPPRDVALRLWLRERMLETALTPLNPAPARRGVFDRAVAWMILHPALCIVVVLALGVLGGLLIGGVREGPRP